MYIYFNIWSFNTIQIWCVILRCVTFAYKIHYKNQCMTYFLRSSKRQGYSRLFSSNYVANNMTDSVQSLKELRILYIF